MRFMGRWRIHEGKIQQAYEVFSKMTPEQDAADRGKAIKLIGRWHDMASGRGVLICETDSAEALEKWSLNWNGILNSEWVPVVDDNEARALYKARAK
jgi:hypothetical protein